tara:strand:- start:223 stop:726 length:504 start_codon:yes stop_codon:yes gene_type:complete
MIVKGLSIITSLCVLLFLGAVGMQKLVKISDAPHQEEKRARYEQMDSVDETRKDVESREVLNEIREKAENMILGAKKIAVKGLKKIDTMKIDHMRPKSEPPKKTIEEDNFNQETPLVKKRKQDRAVGDTSVMETSSVPEPEKDSLVLLHEIDSSLMRVGSMLNESNF